MLGGPTAKGDADYRRGVVLGLTMGEAILLLLFCLLLALTVPLVHQAEENRELQRNIEAVRDELATAKISLAALQEVIQKIEAASPGKGIENLTKEYMLNAMRVKELESKLKITESKATAFDSMVEILVENPDQIEGKSDAEVAKEIASKAVENNNIVEEISKVVEQKALKDGQEEMEAAVQRLVEAAQKGKLADEGKSVLLDRTVKAEENLRQTKLQLTNTRGQMENLKRQLPQGGRGVEKVPCWVTPEGKPEYIFDAALTSRGIILRDRKLPHRLDEQKTLPTADIAFEKELTPQEFNTVTRPLYQWSEAHDCRFFVQSFDKTGATEKRTYKHHLRVLEGRFYKYEVVSGQF